MSKELDIFLNSDIKGEFTFELTKNMKKAIKYYADYYLGYVHDGFEYK